MRSLILICLCSLLGNAFVANTAEVKTDDPAVQTAFQTASKVIQDFNPEPSAFDIKSVTLISASSTDGGYVLKIEGSSANGAKSPWTAIVKGDKVDSLTAGDPAVKLITNGKLEGGFVVLDVSDQKAKDAFAVAEKTIADFNNPLSPFDIVAAKLVSAKINPETGAIGLAIAGNNSEKVESQWSATVKDGKTVELAAFGETAFVPLIANGAIIGNFSEIALDKKEVQDAFAIAEKAVYDYNPENSPFDIKSAKLVDAKSGPDGVIRVQFLGKNAAGVENMWEATVVKGAVSDLAAFNGKGFVTLLVGGKLADGYSRLDITDAKAVKAFDVAKQAVFDFNPTDSIFDIKTASLLDAKAGPDDQVKIQLLGTNEANVSNVWEAVVKGSNVTYLASFGDKFFVPLIVNGTLAGGYEKLSNDDQKVKDALAIATPIILDLNAESSPFDIKSSRLLGAKFQPSTGIVQLSIEGTSEDKTRSNWSADVDLKSKQVIKLAAFGPTDKAFVDIPKGSDGKFIAGEPPKTPEPTKAPGAAPSKPTTSAAMLPGYALVAGIMMVVAAVVV